MAAYSAVVLLSRKFSFVLKFYDVLVPPRVREACEFACKELKSFQNFVERLDSRSRKRMNDSLERIAEGMRKFEEEEFELSVVLSGDVKAEDFSRGVHSLLEKLKKVVKEYYTLPEDEEEVGSLSSSSRFVSKSKMVGLRDQRGLLKEELMSQPLIGIPVVGMAGIGKTTLAREIFEDLDMLEWFDCRVWISVGEEWKPKDIKEAILAQVDPKAHKMVMGGDVEKIDLGLKESLKDRRYLIVLDDVWRYNVDNNFLSSFPDNQNGSHIILTTRIKNLTAGISAFAYIIDVRLLDKEESWDLLREKVFDGKPCPSHLEKAGKKIAEKCDGLPLTIITIVDLLLKAEESVWFDVAAKRKHQLFIDAYDQISKVLYPSYKKLRDKFKVCFLYMGVFPLKYEIPKSRLINLWIAEELMNPNVDQPLEYYAIILLHLFDVNSIVMVYEQSNSFTMSRFRSAKTCGLHSSWWHFCQVEARKTNCFHVLDCYDEYGLEESIKGHSRLSIHYNVLLALKHVHNSIEKICASTARSLLCLGPYSQYMVPVCFGLKFLRRLDALNIRFYDFPLEVLKLVKLRYLALTCNGNLPPSISHLRKLKYLIVHTHLSIKSCGVMLNLPMEIWDMKVLKHLEVMGYDLPDLGDASLQELIQLSDVTIGSCIVLNRVPNLKKLGIVIELAPDAAEPLRCFDHITYLTKLESLKYVIVNPNRKFEVVSPVALFPCLPFSLTKLHLSGLGYAWEEMGKIASLPNLKVLKVRYNAFLGPNWEVEENGFPDLCTLLIEDVDLVKFKWAHGSFKSLQFLRIKHCYKLEDLHFAYLPKIGEFEIVDCNPLVEWHVKYNIVVGGPRIPRLIVHSSWK